MSSIHTEVGHVVLIINADDFGLTDGVCRAIVDLLDKHAVSSTSLMTAAPGAIGRIRHWRAQGLSGRAGVHLQLTGGYALADRAKVPSLIQSDGSFRDARAATHPLSVDEVEVEWRAQISVASDLLGCTPSHLDSHHGMHRRPELTKLYLLLGQELGIPVRGGSAFIMPHANGFSSITTDSILREWTTKGEDEIGLGARLSALLEAEPASRSVEVVAHPGFVDADLHVASSLVGPREIERLALQRFASVSAIASRHIRRASYSELAAFRFADGLP